MIYYLGPYLESSVLDSQRDLSEYHANRVLWFFPPAKTHIQLHYGYRTDIRWKGYDRDCWFNAREGGHSFILQGRPRCSTPPIWTHFFQIWHRIIGQSVWSPFTDLQKNENHLNIGIAYQMKAKKAVLQWTYIQTSERSNNWLHADLHWPLMTSKLSNLEHMHAVYAY